VGVAERRRGLCHLWGHGARVARSSPLSAGRRRIGGEVACQDDVIRLLESLQRRRRGEGLQLALPFELELPARQVVREEQLPHMRVDLGDQGRAGEAGRAAARPSPLDAPRG
jgi:hypothetical protein